MSLSLLQGYSSAEEEEEQRDGIGSEDDYGTSSDDDDDRSRNVPQNSYTPLFELSKPSPNGETSLPSAFDVFAEVSGPPDFLNNCVDAPTLPDDDGGGNRWHSRKRNRKDKRDLPAGVVMEAKAQLVGIHERVRSDIDGNANPIGHSSESSKSTQPEGGKRVVSVANPNAEDAAELLRMCLQCGVPKTFSNAKGMVCPICGDRPPIDPNSESLKKKGSMIKDKEKNKRMKGQSSHSTWKSETEMALRQQFD